MKTKLLSYFFLFVCSIAYAQTPNVGGYIQARDITPTTALVLLGTSVSGANSTYNLQYSTVSAAHLDVAPTNGATQVVTPAQGFLYLYFNMASLLPNTTYYFRIRATASSGYAYSGNYEFTTTGSAPTGTFPQSFNFDNSLKNVENTISFDVLKNNSYTQDRHGNPTGAVILPDGAGITMGNLPVGSATRSISVWIKPSAFVTDNLLFIYGNQSGNSAYLFSFSSSIIYSSGWSTYVQNAYALPLNQWTHIVTTYDAAKDAKIYVNGTLVATQNMPSWNTSVTDYFSLSPYYSSNRRFAGAIDDLKIYSTALTPAEITNLYTSNSVLGTTEIVEQESDISIYPNPAKDFVNIQSDIKMKSAEIYNMAGQKVLESKEAKINTSHLVSGVYMVKITDVKNNTTSRKLIIK